MRMNLGGEGKNQRNSYYSQMLSSMKTSRKEKKSGDSSWSQCRGQERNSKKVFKT